MSFIYMRDLKKENQTDVFLGKGTEDLIAKAELNDDEIIVGEYFVKPRIEK